MIVGDWKPIETILDYLGERERILIAGCNGCVTVCNAGGQKEVDMLARILDLAGKKRGRPFHITKITVERQCDPEFLPELLALAAEHDAVLSMACGAGVQLVAEHAPGREVFPAIDTNFIGAVERKGEWGERCQACGDCKLFVTGGICPVTRCSKSLMNGPCGGSRDGKCEVDPEIPCAWNLIVDRLEALGRLDQYDIIQPPADWSKSRDGGPRKLIRKDLQ
ncbi:MAG: methylenetetrahydrofolate reductase C-terminal domain-containing protein [Acidobacteria bacterium]|nr:methylenetetrahydrofolate reductase C-terminal domain-containing protein [Acidobacteriota bacterium]